MEGEFDILVQHWQTSGHGVRGERAPPGPLRCASAPYPLHATAVVTGVVGWEVEGRRGLSAGQGVVALAVELHLPHHLCLQPPIQMAAVLQALLPPSLCAVTVFAHSEPIGCAPEEKKGILVVSTPQSAAQSSTSLLFAGFGESHRHRLDCSRCDINKVGLKNNVGLLEQIALFVQDSAVSPGSYICPEQCAD